MLILRRRLVAPILIVGVLSSLGCEETERRTLLFNGGVGPSLTSGVDPFFRDNGTSFFRDNDGPFVDRDDGPFFHDEQGFRRPHLPLFVSRGVQVGPTFIDAQRVNNVVCPVNTAVIPVNGAVVPVNGTIVPVNPAIPPLSPTTFPISAAFVAPVNVAITGNGRSDLFLSDVQMQFVDPFGVRSGAMVIGQPEITTRFGTATIPTTGVRTFPLEFPLGCTTVPTGNLTVVVFIGDSLGRDSRSIRNIPIR